MTKHELSRLLAEAAAIRGGTAYGRETVEAWFPILGHLSYENALAGLRWHFASPAGSEWLLPHHIITGVRAVIRHRQELGIAPPPPAGKRWAIEALEEGVISD